LPAGDNQLDTLTWQPVPGAPDAAIYPLIRKIDTISSNSYLIATADVILLIDPGGLPSQAEQLSRVIEECRVEKDRPLFVFLTHAHIDHFLGVQSEGVFPHPADAVFAVHYTGACALESGDARLTQADLLHAPLSPMKIGLHLFVEERENIPTGELCLPNGARISITRDLSPSELPRERIQFGSGPAISIYHTPGHSPDSTCLQIGDILIIGDLLFAANPGIAGLTGWSQEALIQSLDGVEKLVTESNIQLICPGHGRVIPAADALHMLSSVRTDARSLANIAELNRERARRTAAFAKDCMEQVNELFTIMAGRLHYVSYVLDELGESDMAEQASALIRGDTIDELLETFHTFSEEYQRGQQVPVHLVLKAGQVIAKLERTFNRDELAGIIDPTLVQRASRLLSEYTTMLRGFAPPGECADCNLIPVIEAVVTDLSVPPISDEEVLSSTDDDDTFARILLARIGTPPLLADVELTVLAEIDPLRASIDREHFTDLFIYILEDLVGSGAEQVWIQMQRIDRKAIVTVSGNIPPSEAVQQRRTWRFLKGLAERAGGTLAICGKEGRQCFEFIVVAVDGTDNFR
jgi:glyoxylase-like metal-dependent hydrolase (beta-lactamase superfamily II)